MRVHRRGQAEQPLQIDLPGRGIEQIDAPNHFGDVLFVIIEHGCQMVGIHSVAPENDEVSDILFEILRQRPLEQVFECYGRIFGYDAEGVRSVLRNLILVPAESRVDRRFRISVRQSGEISARAGAGIKEALSVEPLERRAIGFETFALMEDRPVPVQTEGFQGAKNSVCRTGNGTERIDIVDS